MSKSKKANWFKKIILSFFGIILFTAVSAYMIALKPNVQKSDNNILLIEPGDNYDTVLQKISNSNVLNNTTTFDIVAKGFNYPNNIKVGRYELSPSQNNVQLVKKLISGRQTPVRLTFNNIRTKFNFAEKIAEKLMFTESDLVQALNNEKIQRKYGMDEATILSIFIPNTYELYWTISPEEFIEKMYKEYTKFWNQNRLEKLGELGLSQTEVSTLASIVEEETIKKDEKPKVAGLYINRLKIGMPLQADPTVKFALQDFSLKRIYRVHTQVESPYNTYKHIGLPPGPIRIPSIDAIDAVLNYTKHNYLYMCAKEDLSGYHNFAVSYDDHLRNAATYSKMLDNKNIH